MTNQGRSAASVATAAGVALAAIAVVLAANSSKRDIDGIRAAARVKPVQVASAKGLTTGGLLPIAAYCFDPLRPPSLEVMQFIEQQMQNSAGPDYNLGGGSWSGSPGVPPSTLTWSFVPDGTQVPGLSSGTAASTLFATMDTRFGGNRTLWISKFQQVFDRWSALTGVRYQRVTNNGNAWDDGAAFPNADGSTVAGSTRGRVRIGMRNLDGSSGVLAFNYYPTTGDMVIDSSENWGSSNGDYRFLRNTLAHEHGHGLGIAHVCPMNSSKLMEPLLATQFDGPQHDDVRAGHARYGDFFEPNNSSAAARDLGTIAQNTTAIPSNVPGTAISNTTIMSIDRLADQDWYRFTVTAATALNVTVTPKGLAYLSGAQNGDGSCSAGTSTNSLTAADLNVTVYGTNGTTVLGAGNSTAAGSAESITGISLPAAGNYYIKVAANSASSPQMYELRVNPVGGTVCPQFDIQPQSGQFCEGDLVALFVTATGSPAPTFQWRRNGQDIPGATQQQLVMSPIAPEQAGTYTCVATNSCGSATSNPAVIGVPHIYSFTSQPSSQTVAPGSPVTFLVGVNAQGAVSYQWRKDNANIPGATGATYHIPSVTENDEGDYLCVVSNTCEEMPSNVATLTVETGGGSCYANCDGSTTTPVLNVADFTCFLQRFAAGESYANCDGSTTAPVLNVADFTCFLQSFAAGCP